MNEEGKIKQIPRWLKIVVGVVVLVMALPLVLYIPPVQQWAKEKACRWASEKTGMTIDMERILVKFPLDASADGLLIIDENGDTMLTAGNLTADVKVLPLLKLDVKLEDALLSEARYRYMAEDSSMVLGVKVHRAEVNLAKVALRGKVVDVDEASLRGGEIRLDYWPEKVKDKEEEDTTKTTWKVNAGHLTIDSVHYQMRMMPTIDNMDALVGHAELLDGHVDVERATVDATALWVDSVDVKYVYPTEKVAKNWPVKEESADKAESDTTTWTVRGKELRLSRGHALYAVAGAEPQKGFDANYIEVSDVNFEVENLYNRGMAVKVPLKRISAIERCGVKVTDGKCLFDMDSTQMSVAGLELSTLLSTLKGEGRMDMNALGTPASGKISLNADAKLDLNDVEKAFPMYKSYFKTVPRTRPLEIAADLDGTAQTLNVNKVAMNLPRYAKAEVKGVVNNVMDTNKLSGELALDGQFDNINFVKPTMLDAQMCKQVNLPRMKVKGHAKLDGNTMSGDVNMALQNGKAVGKAKFNTATDAYEVDADLKTLPLHAVMPKSALGDVTARVKLRGKGFDFLKRQTQLDATFALDHIEYNKKHYRDVNGQVKLNGGAFDAHLDSHNPNCDFVMDCNGEVNGDHYIVAMDGDIRELDLQALKVMDMTSVGSGRLTGFVDVDVKTMVMDMSADLSNLKWRLDTMNFNTRDVTMRVVSTDSTVTAMLDNEDLSVDFSSKVGFNQFVKQMTNVKDIAFEQMRKISLNIDTLQSSLPPFSCEIGMGKRGLVQQYLGYNDIEMRNFSFELMNDSTIYGRGALHQLDLGGTKIDTITAKLVQTGKYLDYRVHMGNRRGTMDNFASVTLLGGVLGSRLSTIYDVKDINRKTGYHFGTHADVTDSIVTATIFTEKPLIGYREWAVNKDNYVKFNYKEQHLDANLKLDGGSSGLINLFTNHAQGAEHKHEQEDVNLQMRGVKIEEWVSMFPFAPEVSGALDADMKISYKGKQFWGNGTAGLKNFCYQGERVGDFNVDANMTLDPSTGNTNLEAYMDVNGSKVAFAYGVLNDSTSTSPMSLKMKIDKFPISTATAFVPNRIAELQGYLNGEVMMRGTMDKPVFSGKLKAEDGAVYVPMFGSKILFPNTEIVVDSSVVYFDRYALKSCNDQPIMLDGMVDFRDVSNPYLDLKMQGQNVMFVDSRQIKKSQLFGRGFANLKASARGKTSGLYVNADVKLLAGSNLTYVLQQDVSEIVGETNPDMVHFVQFSDSVSEYGDSLIRSGNFGMNINARMTLEQGNTINAYLSPDGKNRVQVQATGTLNYAQGFSGEPRLTGRLVADNGHVKYTPPLIKEVNFSLNEGSNITFTGNMMNPTLDFTGVETYKATVSNEGTGSHLVDFLITCKVGGTLNVMDVSFDLDTQDDLTIANELQSMTPQQRSAQAMNLMLYGSYAGANTSTMTNNALYSFLNSQLNSWAASAIKGVDLSFGINQYDQGNSGKMVTSYSYNLSKSLFNDRFKVVVGGNYSTGESAEDNFSENLISDISIEYLLNSSGSMYVRLFRHQGYESILEGEIIETGVGFVLKRKLSKLHHIFKFRSSRKRQREREAEALEKMPTMARPEDGHANEADTVTSKN